MNETIDTIIEALLDLLAQAIKAVPNLLSAAVVLFLTKYAVQIISNIIDRLSQRTINSISLQLLLDRGCRVSIWTMGILLACAIAFPGFELRDIIATLGVGSIAVGFAFQDIFKNFLAGIILLVEEPFRIGDEIAVNNYIGRVEDVDIRTTQIRTYQGEKVLLPNSTVFTDAVRVITAFDYRRTDLAVGVDYNTPLPEAKKLLYETIIGVSGVVETPTPEIDLVNFGDSSIDFVVRYWTSSPQKQLRNIQTIAIIAIKKALDEANISIPYPIRTLYYYNQEKYNDHFPQDLEAADRKLYGVK